MEFDGKKRVVIENVKPCIDNGRFAVKRIVGENIDVTADVFCDSHDVLSAMVLYKKDGENEWNKSLMEYVDNDRWAGNFTPQSIGIYLYTVIGWVDHFATWLQKFNKKLSSGQPIDTEMLIYVNMMREIAERASLKDREIILNAAERAFSAKSNDAVVGEVNDLRIIQIIKRNIDITNSTQYQSIFKVIVDPKKALFSSWYEFFPRSANTTRITSHGTFADCEKLLPLIKNMGFDVVYLPPVHPIGITNRKGKNNTVVAKENDPGSPWAIGSLDGGHKEIEKKLGNIESFESFVKAAKELDIDVAIDIAYQCSPDHPYVKEHPEWFVILPDGTIQFAENPPKKYEDIVPFNFESDHWDMLWNELKSVVEYWVSKGITFFRVDNPHNKPFLFWEWLISEVKQKYPEVIFLSEAFTRPKIMYRLAKAGFTQSYTYFTWRNSKQELSQYFEEITNGDIPEVFHPNLWPNTPDILPEYLQYGGRTAFIIRFVLAATLSSNYGIYGPVYEICESRSVPGKEEYLDSEKYEIKQWNWFEDIPLRHTISKVNELRRDNLALQITRNIKFFTIDNNSILFYCKMTPDLDNIILILVNLDPFRVQSGTMQIPLEMLKISPSQTYVLEDLLSGGHSMCTGSTNHIHLDPQTNPVYLFKVIRSTKGEKEYDYY
jgi:starch synthase (maltosyl-transferring)